MKSNPAKRRLNILKTLLNNPRYVMLGSTAYVYHNGHIGKLPTKYAFELFDGDDVEIKLERLSTISGGASLSELCTIGYITAFHKPETIFEFGTLEGRTTLNFAINSPDYCEIYTLDLPIEGRHGYYDKRLGEIKDWSRDTPPPFLSTVGTCFDDHPSASKITQLYGDSRSFDYSPYHGRIDLIFIDANHEYEFVKSDTENALKMMSDRGIIIWHDYPSTRGVMDYLDELYLGGTPLCHLWDTRLALYSRNYLTQPE